MANGLIQRLHESVVRKTRSGCWLTNNGDKYKKYNIAGRTTNGHRLSFELFNGPIPEGMMVCHSCDNPACINPEHLFLGTVQDNMSDKVKKGRHKGAKAGEGHHFARLTAWQVGEIRGLLETGVSQYVIAKQFCCSQSLVSNIKTNKRWRSQ